MNKARAYANLESVAIMLSHGVPLKDCLCGIGVHADEDVTRVLITSLVVALDALGRDTEIKPGVLLKGVIDQYAL